MQDFDALDFEITIQTLTYATRTLASELNPERLIDRALDTLADYGKSRRIALFWIDEEFDEIHLAGTLVNGTPLPLTWKQGLYDSPFDEVMGKKQPISYGVADAEVLLPSGAATQEQAMCTVWPLLGTNNKVVGFATLEYEAGMVLETTDRQVLTLVMTLVAVSMENANLFTLATVDGLTQLFVRRYYEIRLKSEINRVKREGGHLALMMSDIDKFKNFNDTYGHQQGDVVLTELARVVKRTIRETDIPCRYGGEEYINIFPNTTLEEALEIAENVRKACEEHPYPGQDKPLHVTISAGVAAMDQNSICKPEVLLKRADDMLYKAKEDGRNRVYAWRG